MAEALAKAGASPASSTLAGLGQSTAAASKTPSGSKRLDPAALQSIFGKVLSPEGEAPPPGLHVPPLPPATAQVQPGGTVGTGPPGPVGADPTSKLKATLDQLTTSLDPEKLRERVKLTMDIEQAQRKLNDAESEERKAQGEYAERATTADERHLAALRQINAAIEAQKQSIVTLNVASDPSIIRQRVALSIQEQAAREKVAQAMRGEQLRQAGTVSGTLGGGADLAGAVAQIGGPLGRLSGALRRLPRRAGQADCSAGCGPGRNRPADVGPGIAARRGWRAEVGRASLRGAAASHASSLSAGFRHRQSVGPLGGAPHCAASDCRFSGSAGSASNSRPAATSPSPSCRPCRPRSGDSPLHWPRLGSLHCAASDCRLSGRRERRQPVAPAPAPPAARQSVESLLQGVPEPLVRGPAGEPGTASNLKRASDLGGASASPNSQRVANLARQQLAPTPRESGPPALSAAAPRPGIASTVSAGPPPAPEASAAAPFVRPAPEASAAAPFVRPEPPAVPSFGEAVKAPPIAAADTSGGFAGGAPSAPTSAPVLPGAAPVAASRRRHRQRRQGCTCASRVGWRRHRIDDLQRGQRGQVGGARSVRPGQRHERRGRCGRWRRRSAVQSGIYLVWHRQQGGAVGGGDRGGHPACRGRA